MYNPVSADMTSGDLLARFSGLKIWSANGQRAPHKPLLVLWAIGRCLRGEGRMASYRDADKELAKLLRSFGPHRKSVHTESPFWRLQNDDVWKIGDSARINVGPGGNAHKSSLLRFDAHGGFPKAIHTALQENEELAVQLAISLVDAHFPSTVRDEVLQAVGIDSGFEYSRRRLRDPAFGPAVLKVYGYRCVVCEFALCLNDKPVALEAAHIKWHQARGPSQIRNGLALCALHHRLFDKGAFTLTRNLKVMVAKSASGSGFDRSLGQFDSKLILLPANDNDLPNPRFLRWHAREVFSV